MLLPYAQGAKEIDREMTPAELDNVRQRTAYHEAGHAVIALSLGRPLQKVTIAPNQIRLGVCQIQKGRFRPSKDWIEDEILILLAGIAAEAKFSGEYDLRGAGEDLRYARRFSLQRAGSENQAERLERKLLTKTEYLLADEGHWAAVTAIAKELLARETISGRAAKHLFDISVEE